MSLLATIESVLGKPRAFKWVLSLYPPYLGAGIRVTHVSKSLDRFDVAMPLGLLNRNYVGTHFGGSLYSMCDPFFMLILLQQLGSEYIVWDKAASIRFRKPGRGTVYARFEVPDALLADIRARLAHSEKLEHTFHTEVRDDQGELVADVDKVVHIRRKPRAGRQP